jgi:PAS domain-containing protein
LQCREELRKEPDQIADSDDTGEIVDLIADSLTPGHPDAVRDLFNSAGARAPEVIWSPDDAELRSPLLRQFASICQRYKTADGRIPTTAVRLEDFGGLTERLMIIDLVDDGKDFRYTFYGAGICDYYGHDMVGRLTSDIGGHIATFFSGLYKAVLRRGEIVYSEHEPPITVFVRVWQRLIVPLTDSNGKIARFIVINVPDNELRTGLELMVDPVFVVTAEEKITYANRAAKTLFNLSQSRPNGDFEQTTGLALDARLSPTEMLSQHRIDDTVQLTIRDTIVERLVMTVSATQHRGTAFYVVVMRMIGN